MDQQHEQQADTAPREQYELGHAQKSARVIAQGRLPQMRVLHQGNAVEELAEKYDRRDREEHGTLLGAVEESPLRSPLPDAAADQEPQLEDVRKQKGQAQPSNCV